MGEAKRRKSTVGAEFMAEKMSALAKAQGVALITERAKISDGLKMLERCGFPVTNDPALYEIFRRWHDDQLFGGRYVVMCVIFRRTTVTLEFADTIPGLIRRLTHAMEVCKGQPYHPIAWMTCLLDEYQGEAAPTGEDDPWPLVLKTLGQEDMRPDLRGRPQRPGGGVAWPDEQ